MMVFPSMLINAAEKANMPYPENVGKDCQEFKNTHPHFHLFCIAQLCKPMEPGSHFENAHIIMKFPENVLSELLFAHLLLAGFSLKNVYIDMLSPKNINQAKQDLEKWGIEPIE